MESAVFATEVQTKQEICNKSCDFFGLDPGGIRGEQMENNALECSKCALES